jgi:hypothetical protein
MLYVSIMHITSPPQKNTLFLKQYWHLKTSVTSTWAEYIVPQIKVKSALSVGGSLQYPLQLETDSLQEEFICT